MTCIVGLVGKKGIYIGGDSAGVAGYSLQVRADQKVFTNAGFIFGFTSSFRMGQVLRYGFQPPHLHPDVDLHEYMVTAFVDAVRNRFKTAGFMSVNNLNESGGSFLVGHKGRLFAIHGDFQVGEAVEGYDAVGCGESIAKGALFAMSKSGAKDEHKIVATALEAAEGYSAGVRGPFRIEFLPNAGTAA